MTCVFILTKVAFSKIIEEVCTKPKPKPKYTTHVISCLRLICS